VCARACTCMFVCKNLCALCVCVSRWLFHLQVQFHIVGREIACIVQYSFKWHYEWTYSSHYVIPFWRWDDVCILLKDASFIFLSFFILRFPWFFGLRVVGYDFILWLCHINISNVKWTKNWKIIQVFWQLFVAVTRELSQVFSKFFILLLAWRTLWKWRNNKQGPFTCAFMLYFLSITFYS